jgi:hypothetical protein
MSRPARDGYATECCPASVMFMFVGQRRQGGTHESRVHRADCVSDILENNARADEAQFEVTLENWLTQREGSDCRDTTSQSLVARQQCVMIRMVRVRLPSRKPIARSRKRDPTPSTIWNPDVPIVTKNRAQAVLTSQRSVSGNSGQGATAILASMATLALWNLQLSECKRSCRGARTRLCPFRPS